MTAVVGFMVLLELVSGIDQGMFPTLFTTIGQTYHVTPSQIIWVAVLPLLCGAVSVPVLSKLGDMYGHRRMLRLATALALIANVLMALAPNYPMFLLGRFFQGVITAWLPLEIAIVKDRLSGRAARRAIGLLAGSLSLGVAVGGLVGGYLQNATHNLTATLFVPVGMVALSCLVTQFLISESRARAARRIDTPGFVGIAIGLAALQFALFEISKEGWASPIVLGSLIVAFFVLAAWARWELKTQEPAIDLRMLTRRTMWPAQLGAVLFGMALYGNNSSLTPFLGASRSQVGYGLDLSPLAIGWTTLPAAVLGMAGAILNSRIAARIGLRGAASLGGLLIAIGFITLTAMHSSWTEVAVATGVFGFGFGMLLAAMPALVAEAAPPESTGIATGIYNTVRVLGGSVIGGAFSIILASMVLAHTKIPSVHAYQVIWLVCAAMGLLLATLTALTGRAATTKPATEPTTVAAV
ncbi:MULTISPECIES: MFS transporter [Streptomyces]|uniref:MFS transporter n=1 Tax=Streptomyces TaxID=1883 RepID=UPI002E2620AF|nr:MULTISPECIES: MFS transporter [unclassified Streptomyces]